MYLMEAAKHDQRALDRIWRDVASLGMCLAPSEFKMLLPNCMTVISNSTLHGEELTVDDRFSGVGSRLTKNGTSVVEVSMRILKAPLEVKLRKISTLIFHTRVHAYTSAYSTMK